MAAPMTQSNELSEYRPLYHILYNFERNKPYLHRVSNPDLLTFKQLSYNLQLNMG